ncbi:MAG: hypothetical protein Q7S44_01745 [bacterium]|nr:hypothetical protein [bacterium]
MELLIIIFILLLCFLGLSWFAGSDAPYVPTKMKVIKSILKLANLSPGKVFYELGSGDGRVVLEAGKLGAKSYGIEQSWLRVWWSRYQARQLKLKNSHFFHGDIFHRQYFPADVVYIYMLPKAVDQLESKLQQELKKGAVVITQTYHFKNWPPFKKDENFYLYRA